MGTQQILLIVLSVIIVGVAIVIGISMFNRQAYNANAAAIAADAQTFATEVVQYYRTPVSQGGAMGANGQPLSTGEGAPWEKSVVLARLGEVEVDGEFSSIGNENGSFSISEFTDTKVIIIGIGNSERNGKNPKIETTIELPGGTIKSRATVHPESTTS